MLTSEQKTYRANNQGHSSGSNCLIEEYRHQVIWLAEHTEDERLLKQVYTIMRARMYGKKQQ